MCCRAWACRGNTLSATVNIFVSWDCSWQEHMNKILNIAVIGCGRIGRIHAQNLATRVPGARLAGVADIAAAAAKEVAAHFHVARATADYHELLADRAIEAVAICSSTDTHSKIIQEAATAGKHIF